MTDSNTRDNRGKTQRRKEFSPKPSAGGQHQSGKMRPRRPGKRTHFADSFPDIHGEGQPKGAAGALIEIDREIMKLLVRRATLVSRIRGGKDHAATPQAILEEKSVRTAWETNALAFSKDPRFTRQLFALLQDIKILSKEEADAHTSFALAPAKKPVDVVITGPASATTAQLWTALAACLGQAARLEPVLLAEELTNCVKAFTQTGATLSWQAFGTSLGSITVQQRSKVQFANKTIYAGDDELTLHLLAFIAASQVGVCRLTGGSHLKNCDLTPLRNTLPLLNARLANVVPRAKGLPASIESAGNLPDSITVPADLPLHGVCALLLAPLVWNVPFRVDLSALPADIATAALAEVSSIHRACGADVETHNASLVFTPSTLTIPAQPDVTLDAVLSAYLLAIPAFTGGSVTLKGIWPSHLPTAHDVEGLLQWAGLQVTIQPDAVTVASGKTPFMADPYSMDINANLLPLYFVFSALKSNLQRKHVSVLIPEESNDYAIAQEFYSRLGLALDGSTLGRLPTTDEADESPAIRTTMPWVSPNAWWSIAFALAAFLRPGLRLGNPGSVTAVMPPFWGIYNSLPTPTDPAIAAQTAKDISHDKPARRRIIAE